MYNGIGIATPRGTGTNGYVTRNLSHVVKAKDKTQYHTEEDIKKLDAQLNRPPNQEILAHERKRRVELKCMELNDLMEEQGYEQGEIDEKVDEYRILLMKQLERSNSPTSLETDRFGRPIAKETHQKAELRIEKNKRVKDAFGIGADYVEGSSMERMNKKPTGDIEQRREWEERFEHDKRALKAANQKTEAAIDTTEHVQPPKEKEVSVSKRKEETEKKRKRPHSKETKEEKRQKRKESSSSSSSDSDTSSSDSSSEDDSNSDSSSSDDSSSDSDNSSSSSEEEPTPKKKKDKKGTNSPSFRDKRRITSPKNRRRSPDKSSRNRRRSRSPRRR